MTEEKSLEDFLPNKNGSYFREFNNEVSNTLISEEEVVKCIKTVMDPEIPVNLFDLGLIYSIKINESNVVIKMTLTNPNCPVAGQMPENVGKSIQHLDGLKSIEVSLVWDPPWSKDLMSEDAKLALDIF
jgi:FeS assembly SUF system protein